MQKIVTLLFCRISDEIPDLSKIDQIEKKKYIAFSKKCSCTN